MSIRESLARAAGGGLRPGLAALGLLAALALPCVLRAQKPDAAPPPPQATPTPAPGEAPAEQVEPGPETPRGAVLAYLQACRQGRYDIASGYLDLRAIPRDERGAEGPRLARRLKVVLDRKLWIDLGALSSDPAGIATDGRAQDRDVIGSVPSSQGPVEIELERTRGPQGVRAWRFAAATVAAVDQLYAEHGYGPLGERIPAFLTAYRFLEIESWQWIGLLVLLPLAFVLARLLGSAFLRLGAVLTHRTRTTLDDAIYEGLRGPLRLFLWIALVRVGTRYLGLAVPAQDRVDGLLKALALAAGAWALIRVLRVIGDEVDRRLSAAGVDIARSLVPLVRRVASVFVILVTVIVLLQSFGFNVTGLIAGLGVGGLALALAAQKSVENLFGAVSLILDRPVKIGDFCRFGDLFGTVEDIGLRSTRVRSIERILINVPNAEFASLKLENLTARDRMLFKTTLGLRYETTAEQLRFLLVELRKLLLGHPKVNPDPARVRFVGFGASSLDVEVFAYVDTRDWAEFLAVREDLLLRIMDAVGEAGTSFAFPSQTLYLGKDTGLDAGRRQAAEEAVGHWREGGTLGMPALAPAEVAELRGRLDWPPRGSAQAREAGA